MQDTQTTTTTTPVVTSVDMVSADSIPHASEIVQVPEVSPEERMIKELMRNGYIMKCRDFVFRYIRKHAGGKIVYRNSLQKNNAYIFRYSPPATRGTKTQYYSQVVYNTTTGGFSFDYQRPLNHGKEIWYFPVWYMMNGVTKNQKRQFSVIGLETVETLLRNLFESKQYVIKFYRNRILEDGQQTGNLVMVEWDVVSSSTNAENQYNGEPQEHVSVTPSAENQYKSNEQVEEEMPDTAVEV